MIQLFAKLVNSFLQKRESGVRTMKRKHPYAELVRSIRVFRAENNCTNQTVAELAGISYSKLIAFISNSRVDDDTARAISKAIGYGIYAENGRAAV